MTPKEKVRFSDRPIFSPRELEKYKKEALKEQAKQIFEELDYNMGEEHDEVRTNFIYTKDLNKLKKKWCK